MKKEKVEVMAKRTCFNIKDSGINYVLSLIVPFVASLALIVVLMFLAMASGNNFREFVQTEFVEVVNLLFTPTVFFFIYFIYCKKTHVQVFKASEINFKLNWIKVLAVVLIGVTSVFLISPMISLIDYGFSCLGYNPANDLPYVMDNAWRLIIGIVSMAILPAICEELLFRGLIFKGLQEKFNPHVAIVLSAAMFTLLHGSLQQTVYQFILGMLLGYAMHYGKSIVYPMLLHFVNNLVVVINSFIYTIKGLDVNADPVYTTAWDYIGPFVWFVLAAAIIVGTIFVLRYIDGKTKATNTEQGLTSDVPAETAAEVFEPEKPAKKGKKEVKNEEIIEPEVSIIEEEVNTETKTLTHQDKMYVWGSMALAAFLWLTNTIMQFFGI